MESQKLEAIFCESCSYYGSASVPEMASEAISEHLLSKKFLGEHALHTYVCIAACKSGVHVTHLLQILAMGLTTHFLQSFTIIQHTVVVW